MVLKLISVVGASDAYPDEYVIQQGSRVVFHSLDQLEALARYADMLDEPGSDTLRFVPPKGPSRGAEPVVRGRALAGKPGDGR